jgi:hypothetical protein
MARESGGEKGRGRDRAGAHAGLPRDAPQPEEEERQGRRRGVLGIPEVEGHPVAERPRDRPKERGGLAAPDLAQEEIGGQQRGEDSQRHRERDALRKRKGERQQRDRMERAVLLHREERLPRERVRVPERRRSPRKVAPGRGGPRQHLVGDVGQERRAVGAHAELGALRTERRGVVQDVGRRVDASGQERRPVKSSGAASSRSAMRRRTGATKRCAARIASAPATR